MELRAGLILTSRKVTLVGAGALALMAGVFALPFIFAGTLEPQEATREIRLCLERDLMVRHKVELEASGATIPDRLMAQRWADDYQALANTIVSSVDIRRSLFNIPFVTDRVFIVKAALRDQGGAEQTRYFWLRTGGRFIGVLWTTESSIWAWRLAV